MYPVRVELFPMNPGSTVAHPPPSENISLPGTTNVCAIRESRFSNSLVWVWNPLNNLDLSIGKPSVQRYTSARFFVGTMAPNNSSRVQL